MTEGLDEVLVDRVDSLGTISLTTTTFRHTSEGRDPLSGTGARLFGGRWNPRDEFPAIYLARPVAAALSELERLALATAVRVEDLIAQRRVLHTIEVSDLRVLDLRDDRALDSVGLDAADIADDDWSACQSVGRAAWFLDMQGVIAPSASGVGEVLTVFEGRVSPGQLKLARSELLDIPTFERLKE